ncbi:MAG: HlyC/CorC family transporter, partial [Clostridium sp.]|nr:HlyC/CorC family transporter [Clostridium sp.]
MNSDTLFYRILIIFLLIFINGFLSMAELSIISTNKVKLNQKKNNGNKRAAKILELLEKPSNFLTTLQVMITMISILISIKTFRIILLYAPDNIEFLGTNISESLFTFLGVVILTFVILLFGDYIPKRMAMKHSNRKALKVIPLINLLYVILKPFVFILNQFTYLFSRLLGIRSDTLEEDVSLEEIRSIIEVGREKGVINKIERDMLDGIFEFDNRLAREVMTPRTEVEMIDIEEPPHNIVSKATNGNYSRIPIYQGEVDNIVGIIYIKDIFREIVNKGKLVDIHDILRKPFFAPETKFIDDLFTDMQMQSAQIAVLLDEYGGFSGIATIEDLLEEIVGNIYDEHDELDDFINKVTENTYIIDGL